MGLHWGIIRVLFLIPVVYNMYQVPGTPEYIFVTVVYIARNPYTSSMYYVPGTRYCIGGLHVPYVDHC